MLHDKKLKKHRENKKIPTHLNKIKQFNSLVEKNYLCVNYALIMHSEQFLLNVFLKFTEKDLKTDRFYKKEKLKIVRDLKNPE